MNDNEIADIKLTGADPIAQGFVKAIQKTLSQDNLDLGALKKSMLDLLEYLSSTKGRTDTNCRAVDAFFTFNDLWVEKTLPDPFHDIFADMSGALHDSASAPEIASNFESTPEQLLKRTKEL